MAESAVKKRSKTPLLLIIVFVLPVILAKFALDNDWFNRGATNKGQLLDPALDLTLIGEDLQPKWRIIYKLPNNCDVKCDNALYSLNQIWIALGRESDRVESLVIADQQSDQGKFSELEEHPTLVLLKSNQQNVNKVFKDVSADGIFLVDTLGNVILRYPTYLEEEQAVLQSRDILADLRKLLKLSRIG